MLQGPDRHLRIFDRRCGRDLTTARVEDPLRQRELSDAGLAALKALDYPRGYGVVEDDLVSTRQDSEMREIYAALLLSIVLVFLGVLAARSRPVSQFPEISPPRVIVELAFPGASADVVRATMTMIV